MADEVCMAYRVKENRQDKTQFSEQREHITYLRFEEITGENSKISAPVQSALVLRLTLKSIITKEMHTLLLLLQVVYSVLLFGGLILQIAVAAAVTPEELVLCLLQHQGCQLQVSEREK